jgi:pyruvate kinase
MTYEIVATLGPASEAEATWQALLAAGATGFRLNTSHLPPARLQAWVERLDAFLAGRAPRPALVLDLQGSKWRLGQFPDCTLVPGQRVFLVCAASTDRPNVLPVPHPDFFLAASGSSGDIVLDDARLRLALESTAGESLVARVGQGGLIVPRKGITYTASTHRQESFHEADRAIVASTKHFAGVRYALSYVKDAVEMASYRAEVGGAAYLIAKLERRPALDDATQIAKSTDELWVCRGDLGAELGARTMAAEVFRFSERVGEMPVPVLLAGQIFEHMTEHATPTRSEVCGAHDALARGYRGFVLSDETAIGKNPVESCRAAAIFRG